MPLSERPYYWVPKEITHRHIKRAVAEIERNDVPARNRSRTYNVVIGKTLYPAKHIIRLAAKYAIGTEPLRFHAKQAADCLRKLGYTVIHQQATTETTIANEDDESAFPEGRESYRLHRVLERDPSVSKAAKKNRLEKAGRLACDVCGFDFARIYGELGEGFIEAHHTEPVSQLDGKTKTKVTDLALVCSNCHRMLHRGQLLTINELRNLTQL
jgi:predicted HNH restriction endonuclease